MPSDTEEDRSGRSIVGQYSSTFNAPEAPTSASSLVMPWFYSAPWLPKFNGKRRRFGEWRTQVQAMLRAQPLSGEQQADFVFSALEGEARREVALLDAAQRNTGNKILDALKELYGETINTAQARAAFFKCRQNTDERVGDFVLRLRECHLKWRQLDEDAAGDEDEALLDQFVLGLKTGPVRTELQRHLRRQPRQRFKAVTTEARALEEELGSGAEEALASAVRANPTRTAPTMDKQEEPAGRARREMDEWKEELRRELKRELSEQVQALGVQLVEQLQGRATPTAQPGDDPKAQSQDAFPNPPTPASSGHAARFQWDSQGRPICLDCGEAGHVQRYCSKRRRPARGFQNPPPQRAGRWGW